jgi:F-type H+-transporting ATPase subunit delta
LAFFQAMASSKKYIQQFARNLYGLSVVNGLLAGERVTAVLEYVEKHRPAQSMAILKAYHRLVAAEVARGLAMVEHAGPVGETVLQEIARSMTKRYGRPVTALPQRNDALLAGLRVRVADDLYEYSVASQLAALANTA